MPLSLINSRIFRWLVRTFRYFTIFLFSFILLICLIIVVLPTVVSTDWSNNFVQSQISKALDRQVHIDRIHWSWKDGFTISHLVIPDAPEFSQHSLITLEYVILKPDVSALLRRKASLELLLSDLDINIIKSGSGILNIETLGKKDIKKETSPALPKREETKDKKTDEKKDKKPFILPSFIRDISVKIALTDINLSYDDREKNKNYRVKDLDIEFDAPSVKRMPVHLDIGADVQVNDQIIPRSTLSATIQNLFNAKSTLNIDGLSAALDASLPGIEADVSADMAAAEMKSSIRIDLASVTDMAVPLIPAFPSPTTISGILEFSAAAGTRPENPMAFDVTLSGSDLQLAGKAIGGKALGPGNIGIELKGRLDLNNDQLDLEFGKITFLENSRIQASAKIQQFKEENKRILFAVSAVLLDLDEITSFAQPFIPPSIKFDSQEKNSEIRLKEMKIDGQMPMGRMDVILTGLSINLPEISLMDKTYGKPVLSVSGTRLNLEKLVAGMTDRFPESADLKLSLNIDQLTSGRTSDAITLSDIRLDYLDAAAADIQKSDASKFTVSCGLSLSNKLSIGQILLPDLLQINDLAQSIAAEARLQNDETVHVLLDHAIASSPEIKVLKKNIGPITTGANIHLAFDNLNIKNLDPINLDIKNLIATLNAEDALSLSIHANAVDTANTSFKTDVKIESDIAALTKLIPLKMLSAMSGAGDLQISLTADGRRPDSATLDVLKKMKIKGHLDFIDHAALNIQIANGSLKIPQTDKPDIVIGSLTANPLLAYELTGTNGKGDLSASITAGSLKGLPAIKPDAPISADFSLAGAHEFAGFVDLNQSFSVHPSGMKQTLNISVDGLDRIISQSPRPAWPLWISHVGTDMAAEINIPECRVLKELGLPGLIGKNIDGQINAGLGFTLITNQSVMGRMNLTVDDMNIGISDSLTAEKVQANIDFAKSYQITTAGQTPPSSELSGLSSRVINSAANPALLSKNSNIMHHIRQVHERTNPEPAISFQKADIAAGPIPIAIGESMVMLNLKNGLPNLDYFQFNLLGGTINGSVSVFEEKKNFFVNTALTFSAINTAEFFPRAFSEKDHSDADVSGLLYADFPVTDQLPSLLENADIQIEFTRIGSLALERLLYALDPYEGNEAILAQRRLLRTGSPKEIRLEIKDGFLSLHGAVSIKGIEISLPAIRRLNIAQIPGIDKFGQSLAGLTPVIAILQKVSAEKIVIDKQAGRADFE